MEGREIERSRDREREIERDRESRDREKEREIRERERACTHQGLSSHDIQLFLPLPDHTTRDNLLKLIGRCRVSYPVSISKRVHSPRNSSPSCAILSVMAIFAAWQNAWRCAMSNSPKLAHKSSTIVFYRSLPEMSILCFRPH